jgi:type IV pilus assembly protein PilW
MKKIVPPVGRLQRGLSLVELMVSMAIGLFILAAILFAYSGNRAAFRHGDSLARIQEGGRLALGVLSDSLRMAGYVGCARPGKISVLVNDLKTKDLENGLQGAVYSAAPADARLAVDGLTVDGDALTGVANSEVLLVFGSSGNAAEITNPVMTSTADVIKIASATQLGQSVKAGSRVIVSDCAEGDLFDVAAVAAGGGNVSLSLPANKRVSRTYNKDSGAQVISFTPTKYFVATRPGRTNAMGDLVPSLYQLSMIPGQSPVELVSGVRALRVCYGVDGNLDQRVDQYVKAADVTNWANVVAARIQLVTASVENRMAAESLSYAFDNDCNGADEIYTPNSTAGDPDFGKLKLYEVFTTTVALRNKLK